jgi:hypothetical protein
MIALSWDMLYNRGTNDPNLCDQKSECNRIYDDSVANFTEDFRKMHDRLWNYCTAIYCMLC